MNAYAQRLRAAINHALAVSYRRTATNQAGVYVAHIELVKGIPFYGYYVGYRYFLKVYMLNPAHVTRLADLLRQGAVMMKPIQPYESHMQYIPQWMCDFNLYGCAYLDSKKVLFRSPVPEYEDLAGTSHMWHDRSISPLVISEADKWPRQSHCPLEVDISVEDITNRFDIEERRIHHDFMDQDYPASGDQKLVHSMAGLWRDETRRRKARMGLKDSDGSPFPPEVLISVSADPRNTSPGGWIHEEEYRKKMTHEIIEEKANSTTEVSFTDFVGQGSDEGQVKTAFESITDLFPSKFSHGNFLLAQESNQTEGSECLADSTQAEVDETCILALQDEYFTDPDDEREKAAGTLDRVGNGEKTSDDKTTTLSATQLQGSTDPRGIEELLTTLEPTAQSAMPDSSLELEKAGVRGAGRYDHAEYDLFDIQPAYRSNVYKAKNDETAYDVNENGEEPRKRRKLASNSDDNMLLDGQNLESPDPSISSQDFGTRGVHEKGARNTAITGPDPRQKEVEYHSSSQTTRQKKMERLAFPIVKDPQDPSTIRRLSQRSQESRDSQKMEGNCVQSETSSTSKNNIYSESRPDGSTPAIRSSHFATQRPVTFQGILELFKPFNIRGHGTLLCYALKPPSSRKLIPTLKQYGLSTVQYLDAYYGDEADVPDIEREYAGKGFRLESTTVPYLKEFAPGQTYLPLPELETQSALNSLIGNYYGDVQRTCSIRNWELKKPPPRRISVLKWLQSNQGKQALLSRDIFKSKYKAGSQISGATQKYAHGFKYSQKQAGTSVRHETQYMSLMSLEIHANSRGSLLPDPEKDPVACIFWRFQSDGSEAQSSEFDENTRSGVVITSESKEFARNISRFVKTIVEVEATELDLMNRMVDIVRNLDPDILTGFEVHNGSWGYLIERARRQYEYDLCEEFSRTKSQSHGRIGKTVDPWGFNHTSTIRITGRHMINIWRAMRGELNLLQYTLENIVFHILHRRVPQFAHKDLTEWYKSGKPRELARIIDYYISRAHLDIEILQQNELIPRTSEQARLLGVDFFSVFSRGSQFKVESLMFRIAKPENFILISPSRKQVGQQNALECLPLVMEPQSAFYPSPLLVLDFQSLYPSVMIAYNYCYSTFLGRIVKWRDQNKMGFTDYKRQQRVLELLKDHVNVAPNGIIYARPEVRKSLLAKMLGEILETRVMVKSGMKVDKDDKTLQRLLNNRQLALKLIANVTYGYTSASFSGRMPCSEIADSIVQTGRETLEKAIALIHSVERWGAEVVYGDTDSLFVYLKGRTRNEAFDIGQEIAKAVTSMNPKPVKLKFEKVYHPCVLLAKKRYVGFKYENKKQKKPDFDAKGIETVRRDGTPAEQKIEERALKVLFRTSNLSSVKAYFQRQCAKVMKGDVSIQDFCFAREVKLGTYSDRGPPPPGALISTRRMLEDPRAEPQYGERVPYVVIAGAPGARLIDRCVAPEVLLEDDQHDLDADYYITKNLIPPLERIFNLVGANVRQWYDEMPKFQRARRAENTATDETKQLAVTRKTLESYLKASACLVCKQRLEEAEFPLCPRCVRQPHVSLLALKRRLSIDEKKVLQLHEVCASCSGLPLGDEIRCKSKDCPVFYTRTRHTAVLSGERGVIQPVMRMLESVNKNPLLW